MIFRFGAYEFDEEAGELRRVGAPVNVQPKPLALLALLLRERERIVSQDELFETLWPDAVVTSGSLTRAISHARRAIGDTNKGALIRSFPRRGYRFMGEVVAENGDAAARNADAEVAPTLIPAPDSVTNSTAVERSTAAAAGSHRGIFVGRVEARSMLQAALERTCSGEGAIALVTGGAGIGKTRLTEVFAEEATRRGALVVLGRCREGDGAPPFWLWAQVLRTLLAEDVLGEEVREIARSGELTGLIPSLAALTDAAPASPALPPEQRRFLFFDAVARALASASRVQPLVLILEDLQWANAASLRLLEHLAFELESHPVLTVATVRDEPRERGHPVDRTVPLIRQREISFDIQLGAFSRGEVAALLRAVIGAVPPADLTSELFARTEGVPLFVREAVRLLAERGDLAHPERISARGIALPGQAAELIGQALDALTESSAAMLGSAAVLGRTFSLPAVAAISDLPRAETLDLLDQAIAAGIVEALPDAAGYRFTHALFRDAAYEALPSGVRARLHLHAAERLEQQNADDPRRVIAELAHHHFEAIAIGDPERAFDCANQAAEAAEQLSAYEQAAVHYTQAARSLEHCEGVAPERRLATLLRLGEAERLGGERELRREAYAEAMERARTLGLHREFAQAAIGYCALSEWSPRDEFAQRALEEALAGLPEEYTTERSRLTARLAYLSISGTPTRAEQDARESARLARASGDPEALQEALYTLHYVLAGPDNLEERRAMVSDLSEAATASTLRDTCVIALLDVACDYLMLGDLAGASEMREDVRRLSESYPSPSMIWHTRVYDAGVVLMQGDFARVEPLSVAALHVGQRIQHPFAAACHSGQIMQVRRELGDDAAVQKQFAPFFDTRKGPTHWVRAVLGRAELTLGNDARAREILDRLLERGVDAIPRGIRFASSVVEIAHLCAELGDTERAQALYRMLKNVEHLHGVMPVPVNYGGPVAHCLARLSETLGLADEAADFYAQATNAANALGARPAVARIGVDWARLLLRGGDRQAAEELASESSRNALALGMRRVAAEALAVSTRISG